MIGGLVLRMIPNVFTALVMESRFIVSTARPPSSYSGGILVFKPPVENDCTDAQRMPPENLAARSYPKRPRKVSEALSTISTSFDRAAVFSGLQGEAERR